MYSAPPSEEMKNANLTDLINYEIIEILSFKSLDINTQQCTVVQSQSLPSTCMMYVPIMVFVSISNWNYWLVSHLVSSLPNLERKSLDFIDGNDRFLKVISFKKKSMSSAKNYLIYAFNGVQSIDYWES